MKGIKQKTVLAFLIVAVVSAANAQHEKEPQEAPGPSRTIKLSVKCEPIDVVESLIGAKKQKLEFLSFLQSEVKKPLNGGWFGNPSTGYRTPTKNSTSTLSNFLLNRYFLFGLQGIKAGIIRNGGTKFGEASPIGLGIIFAGISAGLKASDYSSFFSGVKTDLTKEEIERLEKNLDDSIGKAIYEANEEVKELQLVRDSLKECPKPDSQTSNYLANLQTVQMLEEKLALTKILAQTVDESYIQANGDTTNWIGYGFGAAGIGLLAKLGGPGTRGLNENFRQFLLNEMMRSGISAGIAGTETRIKLSVEQANTLKKVLENTKASIPQQEEELKKEKARLAVLESVLPKK